MNEQSTTLHLAKSKVIDLEETSAVVCEGDLKAFAKSRFPVWIFDINRSRIVWANDAALVLWEASSKETLKDRDLSADMSPSVRGRLLQYQKEIARGTCFDESWTIYPHGVPKTIACRFRGCRLFTGEVAMLCEAQLTEEGSSTVLRRSQALLYTNAMVTIYSNQGVCIYANPAALRAFSQSGTGLSTRILDGDVGAELLKGFNKKEEGHYITKVRTQAGVRIHEIDACKSFDAVTGDATLVLTEVDISEKEEAKNKAERMANQDFLTGLYNRHYLTSNADNFIENALRDQNAVFLLLLDLDRFKAVNDALGHSVGDALLQKAAKKLSSEFEKEAIIGRLGGDEFCILFRSKASTSDVSRKCRRLVAKLKNTVPILQHNLRIETSAGLSHVRSQANNAGFDDLLMKADLALYSAKKGGGGTIRLFRTKLQQQRQRSFQIEEDLTYALQHPEAGLAQKYQPIVCVNSGRVIALEALTRLTSRRGEKIYPAEFIPVAEATGMVGDLGFWALETAAQNLEKLPTNLKAVKIAVNVSPMQFHSTALLAQLRTMASRKTFVPARIELELTETALHIEEKRFSRMLKDIREMGYSLAIDDFGSANSNIARLNGCPVQTIKMDRSLLQSADGVMAAGVVHLGKLLKMNVVAEGVETKEQSDWLKSIGCFAHQGFYYSRPLRLEQLDTLPEFVTDEGRECFDQKHQTNANESQ